jgi:hypothetical protein
MTNHILFDAIDPDDFEDFNLGGECGSVANGSGDGGAPGGESVTLSAAEFRAMVQRVKDSEAAASLKHEQLGMAVADLHKMK